MSRTKFSFWQLETHPAPPWARLYIGLRVLLCWRTITTLKEVRGPLIGLPMILVVPTAIKTISPTWLTPTGTFTSGSKVLYMYHADGISRVVGVGGGGGGWEEGGGDWLNKVLYGEALSQGPALYPFIHRYWRGTQIIFLVLTNGNPFTYLV